MKVHKTNLRRWTDLTKECYRRYCQCEGCEIIPQQYKSKCCAKAYVPELLLKFGKP